MDHRGDDWLTPVKWGLPYGGGTFAALTKEAPLANWIDIIPALPLARGVPVRTRCGGKHAFTALVDSAPAGLAHQHHAKDGGGVELVSMYPHYTQRHYRWRVALDDPQGFGYALRVVGKVYALTDPTSFWWPLTNRHIDGETTDDDRLALAKALKEVMS